MARRPSLPERGISSEDAGLTNVTNTRTKSGSVSSEEGEGFLPKQGKFFKNLTRSLDPAVAPPKKKDYLEEYQKYRAKRAYNLHGVVKQQTIDLGSLGLSSSSASDNAQSRRFSTGANPPQGNLTADKDAKSSTLPASSRGSKGPPPPVAPRKKSINLPVINEPAAPMPKVPSPVHDTPSYILSAVKKEQQRAEIEVKKTVKSQLAEGEESAGVVNQNNLPADEQGTPTEHGVKDSSSDSSGSAGVHIIESSLKEEAVSSQKEQGVAQNDEHSDQKSEEGSGQGTDSTKDEIVEVIETKEVKVEEEKKVESVNGTDLDQAQAEKLNKVVPGSEVTENQTVDEGSKVEDVTSSENFEVVQVIETKEVKVEEGKEIEGVNGTCLDQKEAEKLNEVAQENEISENQTVSEGVKVEDLTLNENFGNVASDEKLVAEKEEPTGAEEKSLLGNEGEGNDKNHHVDVCSNESKGEQNVEKSASLEMNSENADAPAQDGELKAADVKSAEKNNEQPMEIPSIKIDESETLDSSTSESREDRTTESDHVISNGEVTMENESAAEPTIDEKASPNIVQEEVKSHSVGEEQDLKSTESTPSNMEAKETTEKLSKTADLLLSFSQDKSDSAAVESSDLSGIGEELKKLNMTIEELAHHKKKEEEASKEEIDKLQEINTMREEMESMQQEMESMDSYL